jgi:hypothetical protein
MKDRPSPRKKHHTVELQHCRGEVVGNTFYLYLPPERMSRSTRWTNFFSVGALPLFMGIVPASIVVAPAALWLVSNALLANSSKNHHHHRDHPSPGWSQEILDAATFWVYETVPRLASRLLTLYMGICLVYVGCASFSENRTGKHVSALVH